MNIFNLSTSGVVYSYKLISLTTAIVGMYFVVRLALLQPLLVTLIFITLMVNGVSFYCVVWPNVSVIPDTMDEIRRGLSLKNLTAADRRLAQKFSQSVSCVAVKVGSFSSMERNSTPIFLDFVVGNTASFLVGF